MKKIFVLILALVMVLALAACGETKTAEVVENVDPNNNNIVIETPPAVVSGTDNTYTPETSLPGANNPVPTTAPTSAPPATVAPVATAVPATTAPDGTGAEGGEEEGGEEEGVEVDNPADGYKDYKGTINQYEKTHGKDGYIRGEGVRFRVGPGVEYKTIAFLNKNEKVQIVDELASGWCKIWYNDYVGYVYGKYVSLSPVEETAVVVTPTPTPAPTTAPAPTLIPVP